MLYAIAIAMGYIFSQNIIETKKIQNSIGARIPNPIANLLLSLGGLSFLCILAAAYFVGSDDDKGILHGIFFLASAMVAGGILGGYMAVAIINPGFRFVNHVIAYLALPLNFVLLVLTYFSTHRL